VILTSDHGELFERGILGLSTPVIYDSIVRVSLIISKPGPNTRQYIFEPTSAIDLLPTIASIYGQPFPQWTEGQILPAFRTQPSTPDRTVFTIDSKNHSKFGPLERDTFMVVALQEVINQKLAEINQFHPSAKNK